MLSPAATAMSATAGAVALGVTVFTLTRRPGGPLNRAVAAVFGLLSLSHLGHIFLPGPTGTVLWIGAEACLPAALLAFGLRMDAPDPSLPRGPFLWVFRGAALLGAAVVVALPWPALLPLPSPEGALPLSDAGKWGAAVALLMHLAALVQLENVFRAAPREVRYRVKYLLLGIASLAAMRIYVLSLAALYGVVPALAGTHLAVATVVGGAMALYALVRFRLLNVDVFVSRYVIYGSITLVGTGAYLLAVGLLVHGLTLFGGEPAARLVPEVLFVALVALSIALLSSKVRWSVRHFVDRHFYKNRHDYRIQWQAVSRAVAGERTVEGFLSTLARMARESLGAHHALTYLWDEAGERYVPCPPRPESPAPLRPADLERDTDPARAGGAGSVPVLRRRGDTGDTIYVPLRVGDAPIALVALGPRIGGVPYHLEDLELVSAMGAQTAVGVRNLQLAQDLAASRETAALHQLSTFFIHDMKNVTNSLGLLTRNIRRNRENPAFWDDAEASITRAVDQMRHVMDRLRALRESGGDGGEAVAVDLAPLLMEWARAWEAQVEVAVHVAAEGPMPCAVDPQLLYGVLTNLVLNAAEAEATRVDVAGGTADGEVRVSVEDDGCGMDLEFVRERLFAPFVSTKATGMGIGLFQARRVLERFGGRISVRSRPGEGSRFVVTLPQADDRGGPQGAAGAGTEAKTGDRHGAGGG